MGRILRLTDLSGIQLLDSRGNPTVGVSATVEGCTTGFASVPSGASTGEHEAVELRDKSSDYNGLGVNLAIENVNEKIKEEILGKDAIFQGEIDEFLLKLDGSANKENLGANATLGVSMAVCSVAANAVGLPLYRYLGGINARKLPVMMMNIINGGVHAKNPIDFQEFMIMPVGACCYKEALRMGCEVYHKLKEILSHDGYSTGVGDEGGFAPELKDAKTVFEYLSKAVTEAGYKLYQDIVFAMDAAASELYNRETRLYLFKGEGNKEIPVVRNREEMIDYYEMLVDTYPLVSIEDGLDENDWEGWKMLTKRIGNKVQLVGDDLFVTNPKHLQTGIEQGVANAILIKVNQIGTLTEAM